LDDESVEDLSLVENFERLFVETLLECELILFFFVIGRCDLSC